MENGAPKHGRKGRALDNIFIERLLRSVKYENIYLYAYSDGRECYRGLARYFSYYNHNRRHQSLEYRFPAEVNLKENGSTPQEI
ncbi:integrase core domain-containing protein [Soonwooa sp.]|uniref:integrase core domain-containing protein n=1 Tax=Soonwooa sp. TaxID=1938592 RepID=UPI0035B1B446